MMEIEGDHDMNVNQFLMIEIIFAYFSKKTCRRFLLYILENK